MTICYPGPDPWLDYCYQCASWEFRREERGAAVGWCEGCAEELGALTPACVFLEREVPRGESLEVGQ